MATTLSKVAAMRTLKSMQAGMVISWNAATYEVKSAQWHMGQMWLILHEQGTPERITKFYEIGAVETDNTIEVQWKPGQETFTIL